MITLPLNKNIVRCLAHGHREREWCDRAENCARHLTLRHDPIPKNGQTDAAKIACETTTVYRACQTDLMAGYMPLEGFPKDDEQ